MKAAVSKNLQMKKELKSKNKINPLLRIPIRE